jgi:hypothetical protein
MNRYVTLADLVALLHTAYIAFVVGGLALIVVGAFRRWRWTHFFWLRIAHFAAIGFVCVNEVLGLGCPLTELENRFRVLGGESRYSKDFVGYWLDKLIFYDFQPQAFLFAYVGFGLLVALTLILDPPQATCRRLKTIKPQRVG